MQESLHVSLPEPWAQHRPGEQQVEMLQTEGREQADLLGQEKELRTATG